MTTTTEPIIGALREWGGTHSVRTVAYHQLPGATFSSDEEITLQQAEEFAYALLARCAASKPCKDSTAWIGQQRHHLYKITQEELAAELGISVGVMRQIERGERTVSQAFMSRISAAIVKLASRMWEKSVAV